MSYTVCNTTRDALGNLREHCTSIARASVTRSLFSAAAYVRHTLGQQRYVVRCLCLCIRLCTGVYALTHVQRNMTAHDLLLDPLTALHMLV
jgi:hypothetical protein